MSFMRRIFLRLFAVISLVILPAVAAQAQAADADALLPAGTASLAIDLTSTYSDVGTLTVPSRIQERSSATASRLEPRTSVRDTPPIKVTGGETSSAIRTFLGLTAVAFLPLLLVCTTAFLRIIVVMAILRNALGMQDTPPTTVLIALSLFLTLFVMSDVIGSINHDAVQPFLDGSISIQAAYDRGILPLREFMIRQTREQDLALMVELSKSPAPQTLNDVATTQLIPAFIISELRTAFQIGFVIFLPFLLIDLIVSSLLMAMGMMMMPPVTVSLPIKLMMFVLIDGWGLVVGSLVRTFN